MGGPGDSISPAGGPGKEFPNDRLEQDPDFDPATDNPTPLGLTNKQYGDRLLGNTLADMPDFSGLLGMPKISTQKVPDEPNAPVIGPPAAAGLLSPSKRSPLNTKAAQPEEEPATNNFMPEVLTRQPVGLPPGPGVLSPASRQRLPNLSTPQAPAPVTPRNKPQLGPVFDNAATTRHRYEQMKAPEDKLTSQAPVDITNQQNWPDDLVPSSGMPWGNQNRRVLDENGNVVNFDEPPPGGDVVPQETLPKPPPEDTEPIVIGGKTYHVRTKNSNTKLRGEPGYWDKPTIDEPANPPGRAVATGNTGSKSDHGAQVQRLAQYSQSLPPQTQSVLQAMPVSTRVKADVLEQLGPDEGMQVLAGVAAIKQALGTATGRGKGIGQLASIPMKKSRPSSVPADAPRLGA